MAQHLGATRGTAQEEHTAYHTRSHCEQLVGTRAGHSADAIPLLAAPTRSHSTNTHQTSVTSHRQRDTGETENRRSLDLDLDPCVVQFSCTCLQLAVFSVQFSRALIHLALGPSGCRLLLLYVPLPCSAGPGGLPTRTLQRLFSLYKLEPSVQAGVVGPCSDVAPTKFESSLLRRRTSPESPDITPESLSSRVARRSYHKNYTPEWHCHRNKVRSPVAVILQWLWRWTMVSGGLGGARASGGCDGRCQREHAWTWQWTSVFGGRFYPKYVTQCRTNVCLIASTSNQ